MKTHEVPQDSPSSLEGETKACYAVDEQGKIVLIQTSGWSVEETVQNVAWKVIENDLEQTRALILKEKLSPLAYFMKMRQFDTKLLAQNMGISTWRVRLHLNPRRFRKLDPSWLERYAECLDIPVEILVREFK